MNHKNTRLWFLLLIGCCKQLSAKLNRQDLMKVAATDELGCDLTFLNEVYVPLLIEDREEYSYTNHRIWRKSELTCADMSESHGKRLAIHASSIYMPGPGF
jgi:hypothetical protein